MKYCLIIDDGRPSFYDDKIHKIIPSGAVRITDAQHTQILNAVNNQRKKVYKVKSCIKLRDEDTKYCTESKQWIPDEEKIAEKEKCKALLIAKQQYNLFRKHANNYEFTKLSEQQKDDLFTYLGNLEGIINEQIECNSIDDLPIMPFEPNDLII